MRHAWLTSIGAALCAAGISASSANASPAGMRIAAKPENVPSISRSDAQQLTAARPSDEVSPWRHPVKYMGATFSELPIRSAFNWRKKPQPSLTPTESVTANDPLSLDKPTGPPTPELLIAMAQMAERQGQVPQARHHFQHALAKWPGHVEVLRAAARMEDRQGQLQLAESLYQQAVAANPQHAGALNDLGLCLARQGRLEESVAKIERAIHVQPDKALYRNNVATVLIELHEDQRALAHLSAAHGASEANHNMGQLLVGRGRAAEAVPYFEMALQHDPTCEPARAALAQLQGSSAVASPAYSAEGTTPSMDMPVQAPPGQQLLQFPATARSPEIGASSYMPPAYYAPANAYPTTNVPQVGATPRYLPSVGTSGPGLQR